MKKIYTKILLLLILQTGLFAQNYPVSISTHIIPPYSLNLSDYAAVGSDKFNTTILLTDMNKPGYQVKLRLTISGNGITIYTNPSFMPPPLTLQGGVPELLTGSDMAPYFNANNLIFQGISKQNFMRTGKLPEGMYQFAVQALDYNRNDIVSNTGFTAAWLVLNDPPLINLPRKDEKVRATDPQNVIFQWTPRHTGSPNSAFSAKYLFEIWDIWPEGRDPNVVAMSSHPIYQVETYSTTLIYGIMEPLLEPGRSYAYRVRAFDTQERDLFKNNGYSQVQKFIFGDECKLPLNIEAEARDERSIAIEWDANFGHSEFMIEYRAKDMEGSEWYPENTYMAHINIFDLAPNTTYEYKIKGMCGTIQGEYSPIYTVTTLEKDLEKFVCGTKVEPILIENKTLIASLMPQEIIAAGDFDVKLTKVARHGDGYTGTGEVVIPFLDHLKFKTAFEKVKINENKQVYDGEIKIKAAGAYILTDEARAMLENAMETLDDAVAIVDQAVEQTEEIAEQVDEIVAQAEETVEAAQEFIGVNPNTGTGVEETTADGSDSGSSTESGGTNIETGGLATSTGIDSGTGSDNEANVVQEDSLVAGKATVLFAKDANKQKYGYDAYEIPALKSQYHTEQIGDSSYTVPWKSVEANTGTDYVIATITVVDHDTLPSEIVFRSNLGTDPVVSPGAVPGEKQLMVRGNTEEATEEITAWYVKTDTSGTVHESLAGKLQVKSYAKLSQKLVIVPVNENSYPYSLGNLQAELNKTYGQAVTDWQITLAPMLEVNNYDKDGDGKLDDGETGMLANYTAEMRKIIRAYKRKSGLDDATLYLFLVSNPKSINKLGQMPRKRQHGFIFMNNHYSEAQLHKTMAHELGHGAFRLEHPFEEFPAIAQGSTQNLMDYNQGKNLRKYQWDYIHDPVAMLAWDQDEEEGALEYFECQSYYATSTETEKYKISELPESEAGFVSFITPANVPISLNANITDVNFGEAFYCADNVDGQYSINVGDLHLTSFKYNNEEYKGKITVTSNYNIELKKEEKRYWFDGYFKATSSFIAGVDINKPYKDSYSVNNKSNLQIILPDKENEFEQSLCSFDDLANNDNDEYLGEGIVSSLDIPCLFNSISDETQANEYDSDIIEFGEILKGLINGENAYVYTDQDYTREFEVLNDKFITYHKETKGNRKIFVIDKTINYYLEKEERKDFTNKIIEYCEGKFDQEKMTFICIPNYSPVGQVSDNNATGFSVNYLPYISGYYQENLNEKEFNDKSATELVMDIYTQIPKPKHIHLYILTKQGDIVYKSFDTEQGEEVTGSKFIYDLNVYYDKNIDKIREVNNEIRVIELNLKKDSEGYAAPVLYKQLYDKYLERESLLNTEVNQDLFSFESRLKEWAIKDFSFLYISKTLNFYFETGRVESYLDQYFAPSGLKKEMLYLDGLKEFGYDIADALGVAGIPFGLDVIGDGIGFGIAFISDDYNQLFFYGVAVTAEFLPAWLLHKLSKRYIKYGDKVYVVGTEEIKGLIVDVLDINNNVAASVYSKNIIGTILKDKKIIENIKKITDIAGRSKLVEDITSSPELLAKLKFDENLLNSWDILNKAEVEATVRIGKNDELNIVKNYIDNNPAKSIDNIANDIKSKGWSEWLFFRGDIIELGDGWYIREMGNKGIPIKITLKNDLIQFSLDKVFATFKLDAGILTPTIKITENLKEQKLGTAIYKEVIEHFGIDNIDFVDTFWAPLTGLSDNYNAFFKALEETDDVYKAAFLTPSGKIYKKLGFNKVDFNKMPNKNLPAIKPIFSK